MAGALVFTVSRSQPKTALRQYGINVWCLGVTWSLHVYVQQCEFKISDSPPPKHSCSCALQIPSLGIPESNLWLQDLELPADAAPAPAAAAGSKFTAPPSGRPVTEHWLQRSRLAAEQAAAGAFDSAMRTLKLQLGAANFEPLKPNLLALHAAAFAVVPGLPGLPAISHGVDAAWSKDTPTAAPQHPATPFTLAAIERRVAAAYEHFTSARLQVRRNCFDRALAR